jgi:uncharacterized protein (DUF1330 family)
MVAFVIVTILETDQAKFGAYRNAVSGLKERYGGSVVSRGIVEALEGTVQAGEELVVLKFPNAQNARDYFSSEEYRSAAKLRIDAGSVTLRLIEA